jgi:hypothetical protein
MIKIRNLVETTVDANITKRLNKQGKGLWLKDICTFICKHFKNELTGINERAVLITIKDSVIIGAYLVGMGGQHSVKLDPQDHARIALEDNADYVISVHNHPGRQEVKISENDIVLLNKMVEFFGYMDIKFSSIICNSEMNTFNIYSTDYERSENRLSFKRRIVKDKDGNKKRISIVALERRIDPIEISSTNVISPQPTTKEKKQKDVPEKAPSKKEQKDESKQEQIAAKGGD